MTLEKIMDASLGETSNKLTVNFKKTVLIREYETEVIEATNEVILDNNITGIERMFICAILQAQMEYTVYTNLAFKGLITSSKLAERKKMLEDELSALKEKGDNLLGIGVLDKYLEMR